MLEPSAFDGLAGFADDDALQAFRCFAVSARALAAGQAGGTGGEAALGGARGRGPRRARRRGRLRRLRRAPSSCAGSARGGSSRTRRSGGFLTGYYEPVVEASPVETAAFGWPLIGRPADLVALAPGEAPENFPEGVTGARRGADGGLVPYDDRETIERARRDPVVWVRDAVEAFLIQVQGSAQVVFPDGGRARLAYDGRNGLPYTSIGRILIERGAIPEPDMSLAGLKAWLRSGGRRRGRSGPRPHAAEPLVRLLPPRGGLRSRARAGRRARAFR